MKRKVLIVATVVKQHILTFHLPVLEWFQKQGWETHVAAANDFDRSEECRIPFCDVYHPISFSRTPFHANNLRAYHELKRLLKQERFALVHTNTPSASVLLRFACRKEQKNGTKVIYTAHGFHFYQGTSWRDTPWKNWLLYYPVEKLCARWTDVLITINREDYRLAKTHLPAKQVEYVPGVGVDVKGIAERADRVCREEKRKELGIPEDAVVMVSVGELSERKNHKMVLEAWKKIKSNEIWYLICGQGALAEELLERAKQLGIAERFRLLGYRSDVIEVVAVSDLFVFPSKQEGLPVALMEAMAVGVPCVVSNIRGNRELVSKEYGGLFSLDNPEEFAAQLAKVIRWNIQERRLQEGTIKGRIKKENRKKLKKYSREVVGNKMAEIYFNVCREE
ncbi:MAG: glycosyltransferase family 4 protein [Lachnospiraceae bacterium]|nr:glycosyltransferase family 4 protein [Lachnospiraceae bacterium]